MDAQNMVDEIWEVIPSYPSYLASNLGRIKRDKTDRILSTRKGWHGYAMVTLRVPDIKCVLVNKLIMETFVKPRPKHYFGETQKSYAIYHINGNRMDARLSNLQYMTRGEIISLYWRSQPHAEKSLREGSYDPRRMGKKRVYRSRMPNKFQA